MDNEYTPTTEDVEHYYGLAREEWNYGEELTGEQSRAEFYRWLEGVKADAWHGGYNYAARTLRSGHE